MLDTILDGPVFPGVSDYFVWPRVWPRVCPRVRPVFSPVFVPASSPIQPHSAGYRTAYNLR